MIRRSSCGPIACWILAQTSSLVTLSLYEMRSILPYHLISMACILLWSSAVRVHDSQAYWKMEVTREHISCILELREMLLSFHTGFNLVSAAVVCDILESISCLEPLSVITELRYLKLVPLHNSVKVLRLVLFIQVNSVQFLANIVHREAQEQCRLMYQNFK